MSQIVIIAAGEFPRKDYPRWLISSADHIVCCDSAAASFMRFSEKNLDGRLPDAVVGDLDSISPKLRKKLQSVIYSESEQDTNDLSKAMRYALAHWCPEGESCSITIIGAGGKREDHTIGNLSLLMEYERLYSLSDKGIMVQAVSDWTTSFAITDSCSFDCGKDRGVSIFSPDNSLNIKSEGLKWPTDQVVFDNWWWATLNRSTNDTVKLTLSHKSLVLIVLS